ncbi:hypothetical protein H0I25_13560 [Cellulophaga sp. HaHa_2_95]|uniref:hypothetical protein n=1 Tax=unclassified Cellulophaga TaxID=2634405 RepID=UPI001C4E3645|nr:hypothetical protein [Cellulophaga sp. HaHa_2_95]QXP55103.1 hypothetical protein H0I25_13560 [Cellulophaga sp. HaHa_2_95]
MKEKLEIKKLYSVLSLLGLVLLLLLSPCKVRNFIQAEVGLPQTNVLNKGQATISTESCVAFDVADINHSSSTSVKIALDFFVNETLFTIHFPVHSNTTNTLRISKSKLISSIPLYILYQNIQVYS